MKNTIKFHILTIAVLSSLFGDEAFATTFSGHQFTNYKERIGIGSCTLRNVKSESQSPGSPTAANGTEDGTFALVVGPGVACDPRVFLDPANQIERQGDSGLWTTDGTPNPYTTQRNGSQYGSMSFANNTFTFTTSRAASAGILVESGGVFDLGPNINLVFVQDTTNAYGIYVQGGKAFIHGDLSIQRTRSMATIDDWAGALFVNGGGLLEVDENLDTTHLWEPTLSTNLTLANGASWAMNGGTILVKGSGTIHNLLNSAGINAFNNSKLTVENNLDITMYTNRTYTPAGASTPYVAQGGTGYIGINSNGSLIDIKKNLNIDGEGHLLINQSNKAKMIIGGVTTLTKNTIGNYIENDNSSLIFNNSSINFVGSGGIGLLNTNSGHVYFEADGTQFDAATLGTAISNKNNGTIHFDAKNSDVKGNVENINTGIITLSKGDDAEMVNGQYNILYNTLNIVGNYLGGGSRAQSGILTLDTDLVDDSANTDFVTIRGTASGQTELRVNSYNSLGAPTKKGIHIIQTDDSDANAFFIANKGYVTAGGAYDYYLVHREGDTRGRNGGVYDNWYLMNYNYKDYIYTPDIGSYLAAETMGNTLFTSRLEDREGASQYQNLNGKEKGDVWIRAYGGHNQFKTMDSQLKTKGNSFVTQFGSGLVSLGEENQYNLGVMGGLAYYDGTTQSRISDRESKAKIDGYSLGLYGTWYGHPVEERGAYVDSWILWNQFNNKVDTPDQNQYKYKSSGVTASIEVGGDYLVNENGKKDWWVQPQAQLIYQGVHADNFQDAQGVDIYHGKDNLQARMGIKTYLNIPTNGNKLTSYRPYVALNFIHNTNPYYVTINDVQYVNEGSANQGELKFGVEGHTTKNSQVWINASLIAGRHDHKTYQGNLGWKYNF